jgi:hypothetical protein
MAGRSNRFDTRHITPTGHLALLMLSSGLIAFKKAHPAQLAAALPVLSCLAAGDKTARYFRPRPPRRSCYGKVGFAGPSLLPLLDDHGLGRKGF